MKAPWARNRLQRVAVIAIRYTPLAILLVLAFFGLVLLASSARVGQLEDRVDGLGRPGRDEAVSGAVWVAAKAGYVAVPTGAVWRQDAWFVDLQAGDTCLQVAWAADAVSAAPALMSCEQTVTGAPRGDALDITEPKVATALGFLQVWLLDQPGLDRFTTAAFAPQAPPAVTKFTLKEVTDGGQIGDRAEVIVTAQVSQSVTVRDIAWAVGVERVDGKWFVDYIKAVIPQSSSAPATTVPATTTTTKR